MTSQAASAPKISVCIPAYNRARFLPALLDSALSQDYDDFEIVICEDGSPERSAIRDVVASYEHLHHNRICYHENDSNLGYDGNLRNLFQQAHGDYCFIMGNDDLIAPGALTTVASALDRYDNVGVVIRSYAWFDHSPEKLSQVVRYFPEETFFPAGAETATTFFRRVGAMSGIVIHRHEALKHSTDRFDGTLYYQMYLVANILIDMNGVYIPQTLVLCRNGEPPDFGNSVAEQGKFVPGSYTPEARIRMTRALLEIARYVGATRHVPIYEPIRMDLGNYSYPILASQRHQPLGTYLRYYQQLAHLGLWRSPLFHLSFLLTLIPGPTAINAMIRTLRNHLGSTPLVGGLSAGIPQRHSDAQMGRVRAR